MVGQNSLRVLVAEDEALIRMDLVETLRELGFDVVAAVSDGQSAVAQARTHRPDVALLDIRMPGLDGLSAAGQISHDGHTAVVLLTAFSQPDLVERAVAAGVMGYLVKPYRAEDIRPAVEMACSRHRELTEARRRSSALDRQLQERKTIERAKGVVQSRLSMSEEDAYAWLRGRAMSARTSLAEVARRVLDET